ncbi:MAG: methyltransferase [Acidobacteria bacterium]|nr:methyltransferase [Acidobacteriota bacterium]
MNKLQKKILDKIQAEGAISFREYMAMCLYDENYGYYQTRTRIGREGDFFTSAHLGSILGRVLGKRVIDLAPKEGPVHVVELGAGEGYLALDMLEYISKENLPLYQRIEYHFIEQNPSVFNGNQKRLNMHLARMIFYDNLSELNTLPFAFIFSNEFFDAFPVHLVTRRENKLTEVYVGYKAPNYTRVFREPSGEVWRELKELGVSVGEGCTIEINSDIEGVYSRLADKIEKFHMVTIDYGYTQDELYHPDRKEGTLMGYHKHAAYENIFQLEGEMDLTSHVNFDALIHYGEKFGADPKYFKNQRTYLMDFGLFDLFQDGKEPTTTEAFQLKTLLLPGSMGDVFKILVQEKE